MHFLSCFLKKLLSLYTLIEWARVPHVFIIYQEGLHMDFSADEKISPIKNYNIKLRSSKPAYDPGGFASPQCHQATGYLSYADLDNIYIFYTDGEKDAMYIDIKDGSHRTIKGTNFHEKVLYGSGIKVGLDFFMASDRRNIHSKWIWKTLSFVWKGNKQRLFKHEEFTVSKHTYACYASYNRSHFLRVGTPLNESKVMMIQLEGLEDTTLTHVPLFHYDEYHGYPDHRKTCSITFDKQGQKSLLVIAKHPERWGVVLHQLNMYSMEWTRAATNMKYYG